MLTLQQFSLLLLIAPAAGLILCVAVIVTDVAHNSWFALHHPIRMDLYLSQIVFLLFVAFTVRTAGRGAVNRRTALHVID
jgi:xanthine/uracil permease